MAKISLTEFVDIVAASGTSKATKTRDALSKKDYHPSQDFYRAVREAIVEINRDNKPLNLLHDVLANANDKKKKSFAEVIQGYLGWHGKKSFKWVEPPYRLYEGSGISIRVNPEVGLVIKGVPHLIKLYFKAEELSKGKVDIIMELMRTSLTTNHKTAQVAVLDVRRKKLYTPTVEIPLIKETVEAELAYIAKIAAAL